MRCGAWSGRGNLLLAHARCETGAGSAGSARFLRPRRPLHEPTAELADVVLPVASPFEGGLKIGFDIARRRSRWCSCGQRVVEPAARRAGIPRSCSISPAVSV